MVEYLAKKAEEAEIEARRAAAAAELATNSTDNERAPQAEAMRQNVDRNAGKDEEEFSECSFEDEGPMAPTAGLVELQGGAADDAME